MAKMRRVRSKVWAVILLLAAPGSAAAPEHGFSMVILGGRVLDPASGFDRVANVGIVSGRVVVVTDQSLTGDRVIDAKGLIVAPGFIDLHSHGQDIEAQRLKVADGVTTALELEAGATPVREFYKAHSGPAFINYGASVSYRCVRSAVLDRSECGAGSKPAATHEKSGSEYKSADPHQIAEMIRRVGLELDAGAIGIGLGIEYMPALGRDEVFRLFQFAASRSAPIFVHIRRRVRDEAPGPGLAAIQEVLANAAATGASLHIHHVTSTGLEETPVILDMLSSAQARGVDISTEVYPYTAASTTIGSALFDHGWRQRWNAEFHDLEWPATGERLTEKSFEAYRRTKPNSFVTMHVIPESALDRAIQHPMVMIASDGLPWITKKEHPRGAGTFARVLGRYVRERGLLTWGEAIRKMSLMPAQRLEKYLPQMAKKGRLQPGTDADITIFDPKTVIDRATFKSPMQASSGIRYVIIGGVAVVDHGSVLGNIQPGRPVRGSAPK